MFDFIAGLPGQMATLLSRLTATRATNLDNLDAAVSTRAAASTALSTATWTNALAADIALIPSIPTSAIKSIQTGYFNTAPSTGTGEDTRYVDTTITAVNTAKAIVILQQFAKDLTGSPFSVTGRLTSSTNLRVATPSTSTPTALIGRWTVVEFN